MHIQTLFITCIYKYLLEKRKKEKSILELNRKKYWIYIYIYTPDILEWHKLVEDIKIIIKMM